MQKHKRLNFCFIEGRGALCLAQEFKQSKDPENLWLVIEEKTNFQKFLGAHFLFQRAQLVNFLMTKKTRAEY